MISLLKKDNGEFISGFLFPLSSLSDEKFSKHDKTKPFPIVSTILFFTDTKTNKMKKKFTFIVVSSLESGTLALLSFFFNPGASTSSAPCRIKG